MTIQELTKSAEPVTAPLRAQVIHVEQREAKGGKSFWDLTISDGTAELKLKVWSDSPAAPTMPSVEKGHFVEVEGTFTNEDKWGWGSKSFTIAFLDDAAIEALLAGTPERRAFLDARWTTLCTLVNSMADAALKKVTLHLLTAREEPFRRAAAARGNHHARRGGLVEHVTEMAELADGICRALPQLNRSLILAAIVFHDCGKMLENNYKARGFEMPWNKRATLTGHIAIGFQLAHNLWVECSLDPDDERLLLLRHLILSHHGQLDWGSPVEPMCPEAIVLHYIDQLSAKTEMFKAMYALPEVAPGLHERGYPMRVNAVAVPQESAGLGPVQVSEPAAEPPPADAQA